MKNVIHYTSKLNAITIICCILVSCNTSQSDKLKNANMLKPFSLTFEELEAQNKKQEKKSIIYIYDPMCEDCTKVRMYALENPQNEAYMQQHFYTSDISIYEERDIHFNNKTWVYKHDIVGRSYHELAQVLNQDENISAPCLSFLDEDLNMIVPIKKTVTAEELEILLVFVATNAFKQITIETFQQQYQKGSFAY